MKGKNEIILIIVCFILLVYAYYKISTNLTNDQIEIDNIVFDYPDSGEDSSLINEIYDIKNLKIIDDNRFDCLLSNDQRILVGLDLKPSVGSKKETLRLINDSIRPRVLLLKKDGDIWISEILLFHDSKEIKLSEWLILNNLVYQ